MREDRKPDALRPLTIDTRFNRYAEGSALISMGHTRVLCTASIEEQQPPFLRNTERGWVTAEDKPLSWEQVVALNELAAQGVEALGRAQLAAVKAHA